MADLLPLRHSAAHVMAQAVLELFPDAKLAIGPAIEDGFYYDFQLPRPLEPADLQEIESRMRRIVAADFPFEQSFMDKDEARARSERSSCSTSPARTGAGTSTGPCCSASTAPPGPPSRI